MYRQQQRTLQSKRPAPKNNPIPIRTHGLKFKNKLSHKIIYIVLWVSLAHTVIGETDIPKNLCPSPKEFDEAPGNNLPILPFLPEGETLAKEITFKDLCTPSTVRVVLQEDFAYISPNSQWEALVTGPLRPCQAIIITHNAASLLWHHSHWGCLNSLPTFYADMRARFAIADDEAPKVTIISATLSESAKKLSVIKNIMKTYEEKGHPSEQIDLLQSLRREVAEHLALAAHDIRVILSEEHDEDCIALTKNGEILNVRIPFLLGQSIVSEAIRERLADLPKGYLECQAPFAIPEALKNDEAAENKLACKEYIFFSTMRDLMKQVFRLLQS